MMPRRDDEIQLYALLRTLRHGSVRTGNALVTRDELIASAQQLSIASGRAGYLLDKWEKKGWWCTASSAGGWFTPDAPDGLLPFSVLDTASTMLSDLDHANHG